MNDSADSASVNAATPASTSRALSFVLERWRELVEPNSDIGRRARTLSLRTAAEEACLLAESHVRAGGATRKNAAPSEAGHGIDTLSNVIDEAVLVLKADVVLKRCQPSVCKQLEQRLESIRPGKDRGTLTMTAVEQLRALVGLLRKTYLADAFRMVDTIVLSSPGDLSDLDSAVGALISEARALGWTDDSLIRTVESVNNADAASIQLQSLRARLCIEPRDITCFVPVSLPRSRWTDQQLPDAFSQEAKLPEDKRSGRPPPAGPYIRITVQARDPIYGARLARSRVAAVLGAASVFIPGDLGVRGDIVVIQHEGALVGIEIKEALRKERRRSTPDQVKKVMRSAAVGDPHGDPVLDALHHLNRAANTYDLESRFMLLWLGIERLTAGTYDHRTILTSATALVPKAIALGKLRREIGALAANLDYAVTVPTQRAQVHALVGCRDGDQGRVSRERLLDRLLRPDEEYRELTSVIHAGHVRLVRWCWQLRRNIRGTSGKSPGQHIAEYFEVSRQRIEWQVARMYRARNSLAHAGSGPQWLHDLIHHAHFYLTQLVALAVEYRDSVPRHMPSEILVRRGAQYAEFISLLRGEHPDALSPKVLLRPNSLFVSHPG